MKATTQATQWTIGGGPKASTKTGREAVMLADLLSLFFALAIGWLVCLTVAFLYDITIGDCVVAP